LTRLTRAGRRRLLLYPALLSLGAGALASCAAWEPQLLSQTSAARPLPPPTLESSPRSPANRRPAHKPGPPSPVDNTTAQTSGDALAMTAPNPTAGASGAESSPSREAVLTSPAASQPPQTKELIGLDQSAATRLFGAAAERSEEPPATVWRYKNGTCELDLFFYLDLRSGHMRTLRYALKGDGADTSRRQECLRSLVIARSN
jgi:hypothetical protein